MSDYISEHSGEVIDDAVKQVSDSGVQAEHLSFLVGASAGVGVAEKVLVLDALKSAAGITKLAMDIMASRIVDLEDLSADPTETPVAGRIFMYFKSGVLYTKNSSGTVTKFGTSIEVEVPFTGQASISVTHNYGRYPIIKQVASDGSDLEGQVIQTNTSFTITYNSAESGTIVYYLV